MTPLTSRSGFLRYGIALWLAASSLFAAEHHGQVKFGGLPLPGATVTLTQGDKKLVTITNQDGVYEFRDVADGIWNLQIEMLCFIPIKQEVGINASAPSPMFDMKLMPFDEIKASAPPPAAPTAPPPAATTTTTVQTNGAQAAPSIVAANGGNASADVSSKPAAPANNKKGKNSKNAPATTAANNGQSGFQRAGVNASADGARPPADSGLTPTANDINQASDGLLINGSVNNGAASPFAQNPAFGNNRNNRRWPYQLALNLNLANSALNARTYSITGQDTPTASQNFNAGLSFGGPLTIRHIIKPSRNPINFFLNYQIVRSRQATATPGLIPTADERAGDFSQVLNAQGQPVQIYDPLNNGLPFAGNMIPQNRISPQAQYLLSLYPTNYFTGNSRFNYQVPVKGSSNVDNVQGRLNKNFNSKNQMNGLFAYQHVGSTGSNLFGFTDNTHTMGINSNVNWQHRFTQRMFSTFGVQFSRFTSNTLPFFANRINVSGEAGITGNFQDPLYWGPPSLGFASGISGLSDSVPSSIHNQTAGVSFNTFWNRRSHNVNYGADYRRIQLNVLSQQNPRGGFSFTGAATSQMQNGVSVPGTGFDFADFLLGIPTTISLAYGNADKYYRSQSYDAFIQDDWRVRPGLSLKAGLRWDYSSPITELYGRLVNLDIAPGYSAIAPVVANNPVGSLTHQTYPDSLVHPDKHGFEPSLAIAWHPFLASSLTIRAGYSLAYDTSVYQSIVNQMAQQSPLSTSLSIANSLTNPVTLANPFQAPPNVTTNTFAIDPNFRVGYAQNWQLSAQRDLPGALIMTLTYLGVKGTRARQEFVPNSYPIGAVIPCPTCPSGYVYWTSNGNSTREAGSVQLRRRLHNGFTASVQYTWSKALDDASALGGRASGNGGMVAQDWLNLAGERGLSSFDNRHNLQVEFQYSTGVGVHGGGLLTGWKGALFKEWTIATQITDAGGLPLTPIIPNPIGRTGVSGQLRPEYTGADVYDAPAGFHLNPLAYVTPPSGVFGNAGRDSIIGPGIFSMNASMNRSFTVGDRHGLDLSFRATNVLNHVTYSSWVTTVDSLQFGLPPGANGMRSLVVNLRLRY